MESKHEHTWPQAVGPWENHLTGINEQTLAAVLEAMPIMALVIDAGRRIKFANSRTSLVTGLDPGVMVGQRLGEAMGCLNSRLTPEGCGTSEFCSWCGALRAILSGLGDVAMEQECAMLRQGPGGLEGLDLLVSARPVKLGGENLVLVFLQDQSHEKRRRTLERLFLHDVLNTAGGLSGLMELFSDDVPESLKGKVTFLRDTMSHLLEEITAHRILLAAENGELFVSTHALEARGLLERVAALGQSLGLAYGRQIPVEVEPGPKVEFVGDQTLVTRVLINLVKNAVEASKPGHEVLLGCARQGDRLALWVRNPAFMDTQARMRVFTRGYSSKDSSRGLGAYGAKLLTERYLGGQMLCQSSQDQGTTFTVLLPLEPPKL